MDYLEQHIFQPLMSTFPVEQNIILEEVVWALLFLIFIEYLLKFMIRSLMSTCFPG